MPSKDIKALIRKAERSGWTATMTRSGHYKIEPPEAPMFFCSSSPSDHRALRKIQADFVRSGLVLDEHRKEKIVVETKEEKVPEIKETGGVSLGRVGVYVKLGRMLAYLDGNEKLLEQLGEVLEYAEGAGLTLAEIRAALEAN